MSINSTRSDRTSKIAESTGARVSGQKLLKCKTLLWLALPLTLAAGCASNQSGGDSLFAHTPAAVAAPVTSRQTGNQTIGMEIFWMSLKDKEFEFPMVVSINNGVITLDGPLPYYGEREPDQIQRQKIDDGVMALAGVNQVNDNLSIDTAPTVALRAGYQQQIPIQ